MVKFIEFVGLLHIADCILSGLQKKPVEMSKIKYQVCRLMRHLVSICRTLDRVPDDVSKE